MIDGNWYWAVLVNVAGLMQCSTRSANTLYRLLVRKTLYLDIEPSTLGAESEIVCIFTYQVTKE